MQPDLPGRLVTISYQFPRLLLALATAVMGVTALAAGMEGYLFRPAGPLVRGGLLAGAICLMLPGWPSDLAGLVLLSVPVARQAWVVLAGSPREV